MNRLMICYGTRPELIKLTPLIWKINASGFRDQLIVVNTNQHKHTMCEESLNIQPHYQLDVFAPNQPMAQLSAKITSRLDGLIHQLQQKGQNIMAVIGQGDTLTTLSSAQVAFLNQIPFYHLEAGLRSRDTHSPFPEEYCRKVVSISAALHFAPSAVEKQHLLQEGVDEDKISVVGNTVNDILQHFYHQKAARKKKIVLVSLHRKSNQNENLLLIFRQVASLADKHPELDFVWLKHPAPFVSDTLATVQSSIIMYSNVHYPEMVELYQQSSMVITDSGGIMEESAFLGIPRIIIRTDNERQSLLTNSDTFISIPAQLDLEACFEKALSVRGVRSYIYGEGNSAEKIFRIIAEKLALMPANPKLH